MTGPNAEKNTQLYNKFLNYYNATTDAARAIAFVNIRNDDVIVRRFNHGVGSCYQNYGALEVKYTNISREHLEEVALQALYDALSNWSPEKITHLVKQNAALVEYTGKYMDGAMKKEVAKIFGCSPYYLNLLVAIKNKGLNIWLDKDYEQIVEFLRQEKGYKDAKAIIEKLKAVFNGLEYHSPKSVIEKMVKRFSCKTIDARWMLFMHQNGIDVWDNRSDAEALVKCLGYDVKKIMRRFDKFDESKTKQFFATLEKGGCIGTVAIEQCREREQISKPMELPVLQREWDFDRKALAYFEKETGMTTYYARMYLIIAGYNLNPVKIKIDKELKLGKHIFSDKVLEAIKGFGDYSSLIKNMRKNGMIKKAIPYLNSEGRNVLKMARSEFTSRGISESHAEIFIALAREGMDVWELSLSEFADFGKSKGNYSLFGTMFMRLRRYNANMVRDIIADLKERELLAVV